MGPHALVVQRAGAASVGVRGAPKGVAPEISATWENRSQPPTWDRHRRAQGSTDSILAREHLMPLCGGVNVGRGCRELGSQTKPMCPLNCQHLERCVWLTKCVSGARRIEQGLRCTEWCVRHMGHAGTHHKP